MVDIENKEITIGDWCICTLSSRICYKIQIIGMTEKSIRYKVESKHNPSSVWYSYIRKGSDAAKSMYKI